VTADQDSDAGLGQAEHGLAIIRVAAVPVVLVGERLVEHPRLETDPFDLILVATAVYALAALAITFSERQLVPSWVYTALDLGFICALTYSSGGAFSQLRYAFFVFPVGAAFLLRPSLTALASVTTVLAYVAVSLPHPATREGQDFEFVFTQALYLSWMGVAAVLLSQVLTHRAQRIRQLAASRGRLVAEALDAEERERRRVAEGLHDEAIQNLLAARQELDDADAHAALDRARVGIDRTVGQLRDAVFNLHPYVLEHAGLGAALKAVAEQQGARGGYRWRVEVAPEATGAQDQLMLSLGRELLVNAAKHARAREVALSVQRAGPAIVLEVLDDGRGVDPERVRGAVSEGHIGLASCAERVEALGGKFEVGSGPRGGTVARATVPVDGARPGG
jgi:two-component system, NarL family, sensor kinase